jgi:hypothetical protein
MTEFFLNTDVRSSKCRMKSHLSDSRCDASSHYRMTVLSLVTSPNLRGRWEDNSVGE